MTSTIAQTPQYKISVDKGKNRAYLTIVGFWRNPEEVPNYVSDWKKAVTMLRPGFTLLTDVREMKIHPASVRDVHEEAQKLLVNAGVRKVAELHADKVAEMQLDGVSKDSKMPKQNFSDPKEAELWLDEQ